MAEAPPQRVLELRLQEQSVESDTENKSMGLRKQQLEVRLNSENLRFL